MAGISLISNRGSVTLYRTFSYRDGEKKPRNARKTLGKVVAGTNRIVINDYFLQLMASQGLEPGDIRGKSLSEIARMVDFKIEIGEGEFQARRLHHDSQIEINDPRLARLSKLGRRTGKGVAPPSRRLRSDKSQSGVNGRGEDRFESRREPFDEHFGGRLERRRGERSERRRDRFEDHFEDRRQSRRDERAESRSPETEPAADDPFGFFADTGPALDRKLLEFVKDRVGGPKAHLRIEARDLTVKSLGAQLVLEKAAESSGLGGVLSKTFPDVWPEILQMAFHLVTGGSLSDCASKLGRIGGLLDAPALNPARLEEVLAAIDEARRMSFQEAWAHHLGDGPRTAYDIASVSSSLSASKGDVFLDRGLSGREGAGLNLAVLWDDAADLPARMLAYPGRPSEAGALARAVDKMAGTSPRLVLGQRFYDQENLETLLSMSRSGGFLVRVPVDDPLAKEFLGQFGGHMHVANFNFNNNDLLFTRATELAARDGAPMRIHVFLDERANFAAEKAVYQDLFRLKRDLESVPERLDDPRHYQDLFRLEPDAPRGPLMIKHHEAASRYRYGGWLLVLTNLEVDPGGVLCAFKVKESLKAHFQVIQAGLDLTESTPEASPLNDRKCFLGLISMILMSHARNTLRLHNLDRATTVPAMLRDLDDILAVIDGRTVIFSRLTDPQRRILAAFESPATAPRPKAAEPEAAAPEA